MTKNFYVKNFKRWQSTLNAKTFSEEELEVKIIDNGIALPLRPLPKSQWEGGLCDENFNFIAGFSRIKPDGGKYAGGGYM